MSYWFLVIFSMVIGFGAQAYINSAYRKYSKVPNATGLTGAQVARRMLDDNGLQNVEVQRVAGTLSDHYDPRTRVVRLSEGIYDSTSVSAMAVACHECGHAVQHARSYVPMSIRSALVPIANFGSSAWLIAIIIGFFLNMMSLVWVGIVLYAFAVLFHVVTLPVEFNASHRGLTYIKGDTGSSIVRVGAGIGGVPDQARSGARTVLTAAALTYVAGALTSVMQLLYFIGLAQGNE